METKVDKFNKVNITDKDDIQKLLKDYPELENQYLFFNCFIISSNEIMNLYKQAQAKHIKKLNDIEIYYTPNYLYKIKNQDKIFEQINKQIKKILFFKRTYILLSIFINLCKSKRRKREKRTK